MRRFFIIAVMIVGGAVATQAQGFPWEIFQARTLKEVTALTLKAVERDDTYYFATNQLETKAEVTFTGQSRPLPATDGDFLYNWAGTLTKPKDYAPRYEAEYLYKEGDDEYWLATQAPVAKYFAKELKPGDKITLYLISIGAYRTRSGFNCMLLVEEYQKVPVPDAADTNPK